MKNLNTFLAAVLLILLVSCQPEQDLFENAICIENINTIDPSDGLKENQTVIVKDGKADKHSRVSMKLCLQTLKEGLVPISSIEIA